MEGLVSPEEEAVRRAWKTKMKQENQICKCGHDSEYHSIMGCHNYDRKDGKICPCKKFEAQSSHAGTLSSKKYEDYDGYSYRESDNKNFIKKLKEDLCREMIQRPHVKHSSLDRISQPYIMYFINKLAGKDLI